MSGTGPDGARAFTFAGRSLVALASGALWWPQLRTLLVSDLHLGRSERQARRGGPLLPPFETAETLDRLEAALASTDPARVVSLGDAFDDAAAAGALDARALGRIARMAEGRDWRWLAGNHDPLGRAPPPGLPGDWLPEWTLDGLTLRHEARPGAGPDISGHYHPKLRLAGRLHPAMLVGREHLVLPAFGAFTGGLDATRPPLCDLVGPGIALVTGAEVLAVPLTGAGGRRLRG